MSEREYQVYVYAEQCAMAGRRAPEEKVEWDRGDEDDWEPSHDYVEYRGTFAELAELAEKYSKPEKGPYYWRTARTIREEIGWREPVESDE